MAGKDQRCNRQNDERRQPNPGYLITAAIPVHLLKKAAAAGEMVIRLKAEESLSGGLAIYGERFGRYPLDPTIALVIKQ